MSQETLINSAVDLQYTALCVCVSCRSHTDTVRAKFVLVYTHACARTHRTEAEFNAHEERRKRIVGGALSQEAPPAPGLVQMFSGVSSVVVLRCQAPPGHSGQVFQLYRVRTLALSLQFDSERSYADFQFSPNATDTQEIYCCRYDHSMYSSYTRLLPTTLELPAPRLSQEAEGALVCTGSPSYPGAHFSLFQQGSSSALATKRANVIQHSVQFPASGQLTDGERYQCQYSVLLGNNWAHSELSSPVQLLYVTGSPPTDNHPPQTGVMDLPLVFGSISAALLFLMVFIFLWVGIQKYAKSAAKKRRQREQEQFWKQVHSRDHIVDLTLQRVSIGFKEDEAAAESEPIYDCPLSTFTHPPGY
ncbi:uncharacterized protein LOC131362014 isoform X4 [Hemibagrus wyckioides]|uniref:uncharacterized protein LOC131362014 isoform X4 n=1 Tax=Hemibagrus wyckioides TaxID=337641 RepID=UPI00266CA3AB|nr:uncharacterized protein LOC131362014 isoform X4 [Hemibagrus wyckioides]